MILILRIFGALAAIGTLFYVSALIFASGRGGGIGGFVGTLIAALVSLAFTILWFWLAARLSARRKAAWAYAMSLPCQQCGSPAAIGYRVCRNCGRVKAPGL